MSERSEHVIAWRIRTKKRLIEQKGGKCERCGYDKIEYPRVFQFHHRDPKQKDFSISGKSFALAKLEAELDKCIMLCANCHSEIHDDIDRERRELRGAPLRPKGWRSRTKMKPCAFCKKDTTNRVFCSNRCNAAFNSSNPGKEELEYLNETQSYLDIAKKYSVSEATVKNWFTQICERAKKLTKTLNYCSVCSKETIYPNYCSRKCAATKSKKPSREELHRLKETMTNVAIGKMLGVSETAVRKWLKFYANQEAVT